jgi:hypothetical protein
MNRAGTFIALAALVVLTSCLPVYSLHPFYSDKDVVFEPKLLGTWFDPTENGSPGVFVFERLNNNAYKITLGDPSTKPSVVLKLDARLVKLNGHLFIDVVQSGFEVEGEDQLPLTIPGHMIGRVTLENDVLTMSFLEDDWTQKALQTGTVSIRHEDLDDGTPVLTAGTPELQKVILEIANDEHAFAVSFNKLQRKK